MTVPEPGNGEPAGAGTSQGAPFSVPWESPPSSWALLPWRRPGPPPSPANSLGFESVWTPGGSRAVSPAPCSPGTTKIAPKAPQRKGAFMAYLLGSESEKGYVQGSAKIVRGGVLHGFPYTSPLYPQTSQGPP